MYRYKRLFVSKLFIQPSKINWMGLIQRLQSAQTPYSLLGYCTPRILVRNSFGQIYLKEIFWSKDTGMKLSPCFLSHLKELTREKEQHWFWITQLGGMPGLELASVQWGLPKAALPPELPKWISTRASARNGVKVAVVSSLPGALSEECLRGKGWGSQEQPASHWERLDHIHLQMLYKG